MKKIEFANPFRPGAGHMPPYLAGRESESSEFRKLLRQSSVLENLVLTGLRGVGKTVLLESLRPLARQANWLWVGTDLSEASSVTEDRMAIRLMADLAVVTSAFPVSSYSESQIGFSGQSKAQTQYLTYDVLQYIYQVTPGLVSDKVKALLEYIWDTLRNHSIAGIVFAYDEAQTIADHDENKEFPLSLLLDVFQSIQRKGIPFMLVLTGLPTLFPKLVEARTFAERMFRVVFLDRLSDEDSRNAITKPIADANCPVTLGKESVRQIVELSGGYPYFIQFICREVFDVFVVQLGRTRKATVPAAEIIRKLDTDFFAGRWARVTDRQRDLLEIIASLPNAESEFSIQEIVEHSRETGKKGKPFSPSHTNQMLVSLAEAGLVYKNRHGKYAFAVPLFGRFIARQQEARNRSSQRSTPFAE